MAKKHYYTWVDIENMCHEISYKMMRDNWKPEVIVGITRGGNIPATILSHMNKVPTTTMKVSFRDDDNADRDHWCSRICTKKNVLIIDDINDTGSTFNWIYDDWALGGRDHKVKFATLTENLASNFKSEVSYSAHEVNKSEKNVWLVYPWEIVGVYKEDNAK